VNGNCLLTLGRRFDGTDIEDLFRFRVADSFRREDEDAQNNQEDAKNQKWFHADEAASLLPNTMANNGFGSTF
jgi:hypothetical protein